MRKKQTKNTQKINKLLNGLETELHLLEPELKEWGINYFGDNKIRYVSDLELIQKYYQKGKVLEVGSLPCHLTYCIDKLGCPLTSVDIDPDRAKLFIKKHNLTVIKCNIETEPIPFEDNSFSLVIFMEIFEHLRIDPIFTLKELNRVLKPGGTMILTTPNLYTLDRVILFLQGRSLDDPYRQFEKLHRLGHMGHFREYSTNQVKRFLTNTGFEIIETKYEMFRKFRKPPLLFCRDLFMLMFPRFRRHQIFITRKSETSIQSASS